MVYYLRFYFQAAKLHIFYEIVQVFYNKSKEFVFFLHNFPFFSAIFVLLQRNYD